MAAQSLPSRFVSTRASRSSNCHQPSASQSQQDVECPEQRQPWETHKASALDAVDKEEHNGRSLAATAPDAIFTPTMKPKRRSSPQLPPPPPRRANKRTFFDVDLGSQSSRNVRRRLFSAGRGDTDSTPEPSSDGRDESILWEEDDDKVRGDSPSPRPREVPRRRIASARKVKMRKPVEADDVDNVNKRG